MGTRSSHVIILLDNSKKLGSEDKHDPQKAKELLMKLGKKPVDLGEDYLESSFRIPDNEIWVGAYPDAYIISNSNVSDSIVSGDKFSKKIIATLPNSQITAVTLHSVTNSYAYARYENGILLRSRSGGDGEEYNNDGERIPELESIENDDLDDDPWHEAEPAALAFFDSCFLPEVVREESYYNLKMSKFRWKPYGLWALLFG